MKRLRTACLCSALLAASVFGPGAAQDQVEVPTDWGGLWVAEKQFGPSIDGPVTLHRSGDGWAARLQGDMIPIERSIGEDGATQWSFSVFDQGYFVGSQAADDDAIDGHWIQPPGVIQNYPFATPVTFLPSGEDAFSGEISPFPQTVSLNIPLIADPAADDVPGHYRTFLRNPERNLGVFFRIDSARVSGDEIHFTDPNGDQIATGHSVEPGARFRLVFSRSGDMLDFTRGSRETAPGFYPRRSADAPTGLVRPAEDGDGWPTRTPAETGLDEGLLTKLIGEIATFEPTALRQPYIHSVLIAHQGQLVVEEYFHGFHKDMPHDSRSAGKTIGSVLLGIAIEQGFISSVDAPVYPYFGGVDRFANPDPRKERLTLRHLVTMSQGFDCNDEDYDTPGNEDVMQSQTEQTDWYRYILDLAMVGEPGETDIYCSGGINLIGGVVQEASGMSLPRFFHETFAVPLGITHYHMNLSPTHEGYLGGGIRLRPRDFLKLGQVYLDGGVWKGQRLVAEDWVEASFAAQASLNAPDDYGFAWWRRTFEVSGQNIETYYASGNGGQLLFVVPALDLVVQINGGNYSDGRTRNAFRDRFMREFILPAAMTEKSGAR